MAWAPAQGAAAYGVALHDGSRRIFLTRTKHNGWLSLSNGRTQAIDDDSNRVSTVGTSGLCRAGARRAAARPVVQASLTIPAA